MQYTFTGLPLPLRVQSPVPLSDAELLAFCEKHDSLRVERDEHGVLLLMTPATGTTANANLYLSRVFGNWTEEDGRGLAFDSSGGFSLPDGSMRSPDVAWMSFARWNQLTEDQQNSFVPAVPEFVIELRSKTDRLRTVERKMEKWIANGAQLAWLIDPKEKTATLYRQNREPERLSNPAEVVGEGPIAGFSLPLARIFR